MSRTLVTKGGGYNESALVPLLPDRGREVRVLDRFFFGKDRLPNPPRLELVTEDTRRLSRGHFRRSLRIAARVSRR